MFTLQLKPADAKQLSQLNSGTLLRVSGERNKQVIIVQSVEVVSKYGSPAVPKTPRFSPPSAARTPARTPVPTALLNQESGAADSSDGRVQLTNIKFLAFVIDVPCKGARAAAGVQVGTGAKHVIAAMR